eukprot:TRINITY_DN2591_c6_g1_i1.p3 TRINITY_DN2591_c6_g1~~TRINITY_DN2591_c6_g1_i1.p3  ORF type:complete len:105 (+),score=31.88 TRINITY_DN2591_c6_g1_i1:992-1306(+)
MIGFRAWNSSGVRPDGTWDSPPPPPPSPSPSPSLLSFTKVCVDFSPCSIAEMMKKTPRGRKRDYLRRRRRRRGFGGGNIIFVWFYFYGCQLGDVDVLVDSLGFS